MDRISPSGLIRTLIPGAGRPLVPGLIARVERPRVELRQAVGVLDDRPIAMNHRITSGPVPIRGDPKRSLLKPRLSRMGWRQMTLAIAPAPSSAGRLPSLRHPVLRHPVSNGQAEVVDQPPDRALSMISSAPSSAYPATASGKSQLPRADLTDVSITVAPLPENDPHTEQQPHSI